jgi:hypothetical protein
MAIINSQLETTQKDVLTVPPDASYAITNVLVCNTSTNQEANFDMHLIQNAKTLGDIETKVVSDLLLPPGETFTFDTERIVLDSGDKVAFVANPDIGSGLTELVATISYLEV